MAESVLEKLNLSHEEMSRFSKAMKDPKFMALLDEYSKEISEPGSKEEAESYIKMMEERSNFSMDGKELIVPQVDFCAKTRNKLTSGKVFINICHSDKVAKPTATPRSDKSGVEWEIPYSLAPTRRDKDKVGNDCEVHDFVVNTETHNRAQESRHFKKFLVETAMDAIEKQRGVKLDRDFTLPKLSYKGPTKVPKMLTVPKDKIALKEKVVTSSKDPKEQEQAGKNLTWRKRLVVPSQLLVDLLTRFHKISQNWTKRLHRAAPVKEIQKPSNVIPANKLRWTTRVRIVPPE